MNLIITLVVLTLVMIYWMVFYVEDYAWKIKSKKDFLLSLIVFYWWVILFREFWRELN